MSGVAFMLLLVSAGIVVFGLVLMGTTAILLHIRARRISDPSYGFRDKRRKRTSSKEVLN